MACGMTPATAPATTLANSRMSKAYKRARERLKLDDPTV